MNAVVARDKKKKTFLVIPLVLTMQECLVNSILRKFIEMGEEFVCVLVFVRFPQVKKLVKLAHGIIFLKEQCSFYEGKKKANIKNYGLKISVITPPPLVKLC